VLTAVWLKGSAAPDLLSGAAGDAWMAHPHYHLYLYHSGSLVSEVGRVDAHAEALALARALTAELAGC
jgi:hypothetical protein